MKEEIRYGLMPAGNMLLLPLLILSTLLPPALHAQTFTRITTGAMATDAGHTFGASWVDYDNDDDLDLYVVAAATAGQNFLYRNEGTGSFTKIADSIILNDIQAAIGTCWGDYDNDGDLDVYNAGTPNSFLYRNNGGSFAKITDGDIGGATDNRGWSCAWGDYNNDGFVDLFVSHPAGFVGLPAIPNTLFQNDGDGSFTRITDSPIVMGTAPFTVGNWIDYDVDGDLDLFIGSGPATGTKGPDFLYHNLLVETGTASFEHITDMPIAEDRDGQTWNFIDYDNDGDLDGFVTNYSSFPNELYQNDNGTYVKVTSGALVTDAASSLANVWGDFDNDGDLDVFITNEQGSDNVYYQNEGPPDYTFTRTSLFDGTATGNYGATAGDYDDDGDLDLFVPSHSNGGHQFYQTTAPAENHWLKLKLVGVASNRAAIGATVEAIASIDGQTTTQHRTISTQNTFNGHSSLNIHFGLGNASVVETVTVRWPSGAVDVLEEVAADQFLVVTEGVGASPVALEDEGDVPDAFALHPNYPNPFNPTTTIRYTLPERRSVTLSIYDMQGRLVQTLVQREQGAGTYAIGWDGTNAQGETVASGAYLYRLRAGAQAASRVLVLIK